MVRTADPVANSLRREAILDAAEGLIRTRGYEQMSIQDVQDELGVSRGAIYHYFASKSDLLEAVVERMAGGIVRFLEPIAADPDLPASTKLQAVFADAGRWKAERSEFLLALMRSWYSEDNDLMRLRLTAASTARLTPLLHDIIRQGVDEGAFTASWPEETADILVTLLNGTGDTIGRLLLARHDGLVPVDDVRRTMAAYDEAIERLVGLTPGSFHIVDDEILHTFFG
jgi:AcrR family transcriptional regulator